MRYNELTYHKANPFYKQGYLPDRAWYNRKPKEFPSEIPTGQDYFTDSGRKHYEGRFNHSQIQEKGVLTSPEKYPYQNRIAFEKTYMRSLDTTDIEGAGSGTRVNEAIRNKLRAQQQLARKYNQSLDLRENKEHEYQQKRRQLASKQHQTVQTKKIRMEQKEELENSRLSNPEVKGLQSQNGQYPQYAGQPYDNRQYEHYGDPYIKLPLKYSKNRQEARQEPPYSSQPLHSLTPPVSSAPTSPPPSEEINRSQVFNANDRHQSNPSYMNHYDMELQRRREDYMKTIEMDSLAREKLTDKKEFRKYNPTNLSFNLAGQSIVGGKQ